MAGPTRESASAETEALRNYNRYHANHTSRERQEIEELKRPLRITYYGGRATLRKLRCRAHASNGWEACECRRWSA